jgi:hypothetical protein
MKRAGTLWSRLGGLVMLTAALGWLTLSQVNAQPPKSDSKVKVTAKAEKPDDSGKQRFLVTLKIEPKWHLYANPVRNDLLDTSATTITVTAPEKPEGVRIEYPKGKQISDKMLGDYYIYEDEVTIKGSLQRVKGDTSPLKLRIKVSACIEENGQGHCLPSGNIYVTLD